MRLSAANLDRLAPEVARFAYDRDAQDAGIVHFGIGAFHRAHQAWYTDRAMDAGDRDWAIVGVSLRSADVARQMNPQDGLYTVTERSAAGSNTRLIGSVREVVVASEGAARIIAAIAGAHVRIVSFTITEKGYCRAADGTLDRDLASKGSFYPLLTEAMRWRRDAGDGGLTLLSCDNLADNGRQLDRLMREWLETEAPDLLGWFEAECTCPATMIDRIVPATTGADRDAIAAAIRWRDDAAVVTEPFSQWVIEDRFAGPRPRWEAVGAQLVSDVAPYEIAKLRMLNGAHSALAYLGLLRGHAFVHEAIADPELRQLIERLMRDEAATSFTPATGQNLGKYADDLIARFANPALHHKLIQIAMDGSQKIPQRWLQTLAAHQRQGQQCPAILSALGAWLCHIRGDNVARWGPVEDPLAGRLALEATGLDLGQAAATLIRPNGPLASPWNPSRADRKLIAAAAGIASVV